MKNKILVGFAVLAMFGAVFFATPIGRVLAQSTGASIEDLQKQISQLLEMIKNLQNQLNNLRGPETGLDSKVPKQGWEKVNGVISAQGISSQMWGTHQIGPVTIVTFLGESQDRYLVKAVNDEVLAQLKKYEGQKVTLWGQLQYQNLEGGFWGFTAKKVYPEGYSCAVPASAKVGYTGDDVKVVQKYLATDKTIYPEGLVTGYYGTLTKKAVERYQQKNGLIATGEVSGVTAEKLEIEVESHPTFVCPIPPRPIPPPMPDPNQGLKVYSPSNGETWVPGQTYKIAWNQVWPTLTAPTVGVSNTSFAPIGAVRITLHKYISCLYPEKPTDPVCMIAEAMPYVITEKTDNDGVFEWAIPVDLAETYKGQVIITVSAADGGFSGRSGVFTIGTGMSGKNLPPVVSGVSGPTALNVGGTGTWTVKAYDPEGGSLNYSVNWGDWPAASVNGLAYDLKMATQNTATFTHVYNQAGTFYPVFYVTDDKGQQAKTSMSVVVTNSN